MQILSATDISKWQEVRVRLMSTHSQSTLPVYSSIPYTGSRSTLILDQLCHPERQSQSQMNCHQSNHLQTAGCSVRKTILTSFFSLASQGKRKSQACNNWSCILYCCPDCSSCLTHLNSIGCAIREIWAAIKNRPRSFKKWQALMRNNTQAILAHFTWVFK